MGMPPPFMKTKIVLFRLALVLGALFAPGFVRASDAGDESDTGGEVRVDVVVDMTEAGHKIAHPTPDKPAYYLPLSVGYKEFGYAHHFQRPPPNAWDIEHALAKALYGQGYQLMTKAGHPSLVLVFWWGYLAPDDVDSATATSPMMRPGSTTFGGFGDGGDHAAGGGFYWGSGQRAVGNVAGLSDNFQGGSSGYPLGYQPPGGESLTGDGAVTGFSVFPQFSIGMQSTNEQQMVSMVAGNTINDHQKFPDPRLEAVTSMLTQPRYYVLVSAFDFRSWLHHQPVLLWRAHVSTELWGHYFDQVVGTLINTAAPYFGRETRMPHFIGAPTLPLGRVIVGTPEVKDYPVAP
jgi:hypothetical protein